MPLGPFLLPSVNFLPTQYVLVKLEEKKNKRPNPQFLHCGFGHLFSFVYSFLGDCSLPPDVPNAQAALGGLTSFPEKRTVTYKCNRGFVNVDVLYVFQCYSVKVAWFIVEIPYVGWRGLLGRVTSWCPQMLLKV